MLMMPHEVDTWKFNAITVIESLPPGDRTGKKLYDSKLQWMALQLNITAHYEYTPDREAFFAFLDKIKRSIKVGYLPVLHFEMHGGHEGLDLESGEVITWSELCGYLREMNIAMNNTLLVVLAACYGTEICEQIMPLLRAPFRCAVGPVEEISFAKIEEGFDAFYDALLNGIVPAIRALNHYRDGYGFACVDITENFHIAWDKLIAEYNTVEKTFQLADFLFEVKALDSAFNLDQARLAVTYTLLGGKALDGVLTDLL